MNTAIQSLKQRSHGISLGLFAADLGDMRAAAKEAMRWGCNIMHFDIMDGVFVPQMTGGAGFVKAVDIDCVRDVHLMIADPTQHVASYVAAGADIITVHGEANGAAQAIEAIRDAAKAQNRIVLVGLGIMPDTTIEAAKPLLDMQPDLILILSLDPRKATPPDIPAACMKLTELRQHFDDNGPILAFDGGVTLDCIDEIAKCKPDMIVSGSAVFKAKNPMDAFQTMEKAC